VVVQPVLDFGTKLLASFVCHNGSKIVQSFDSEE